MGPLKVGTTLSRKYRVGRLLAESGGVILYEATDTSSAQRVWIKILERDAVSSSAALARFQREASGAKVLDVGKSEDGLPYVVATEFDPDKPRTAPPPPARAKSTLRGVAPPPEPPPVEEDDEPTPQSSEIPLLEDDLVIAEETPTPHEPKVIISPLLAPATLPPDASALVGPMLDEDEPETVPLPPIRRTETPTIRIQVPPERPSRTAQWVVAVVVVGSLTGISGWYLGHQSTPAAAVPTAQPTAPSEAASVVLTPAASAEVPATTESAAAAATMTSASPATAPPETTAAPETTATAQAVASETVAAAKPPPPVHTAAPARTAAPHRPPRVTKPPPAATHAESGDPLTL